jgi:hypothetical protein
MDDIGRLQQMMDDLPTPERLKNLSISELEELFGHPAYQFEPNRELLQDAVSRRLLWDIRNKKEHWTLTWNFWVAVIAAVAACIAAYPVVKDWFAPAQQPVKLENPVPNTSSKSLPQLPESLQAPPKAGKR